MEESQLTKVDENLLLDFTTEIPNHIKLKSEIQNTLKSLANTHIPNSLKNSLEQDYKGKERKMTKNWIITVEGSAYFGQVNSLEEIKEGFGKQIDINGFLLIGFFSEDIFEKGYIINKKGHYYSFLKSQIKEEEDYLNFITEKYVFLNGNSFKGRLKNGYPNTKRGFYFFEKVKLTTFHKCDLMISEFKNCIPHGYAKFYFKRQQQNSEENDQNFNLNDIQILEENPEDEINPKSSLYKFKAKCLIEGLEIKRYLKIFLHGRTIFLDTEDYDTPSFGIMYDYMNRHIDYVGALKNGDDTYGYGITGFSDCIMYTRNLDNCYEGPTFHNSTASSQFTFIDWPLGEIVDKIGRGWVYLEIYGAMVECTWDNEDTRLIRVTRVLTPNGGDYSSDDDQFTYMLEENECSWAKINTEKHPFKEKFVLDPKFNFSEENYDFYIYADKERMDHHLVNSLGFVVIKKGEVEQKYGKIFMGNAYNEGHLLTNFGDSGNVTLHGDNAIYKEDSLNFHFLGEIKGDRLIEGKLEGSYCSFEGKFNDDVFLEGKGKFIFEDNFIFEGFFKNGAPQGEGTLITPDRGTLRGEWENGVLNPERKFMILTGDKRMRTIRCVLIECLDGESIPELKEEVVKLKNSIVRTNNYSKIVFKGEAVILENLRDEEENSIEEEKMLEKDEKVKNFRLQAVKGEMIKRKIDRILMYSSQMHTSNYYGKKEMEKIRIELPFCNWVIQGKFNSEHDCFQKAKIDIFGFLKVELIFDEKRLCKLIEVLEIEIGGNLKKKIYDFYGEKTSIFYIKVLEDFQKIKRDEINSKKKFKEESLLDFSFVNYNYWDQRFIIYLPEEDTKSFKQKNKNLCKRFTKRQAIILTSQGTISIGNSIDALLHGNGEKIFLSQNLVLRQKGEFFGDQLLKYGEVEYKNGSIYKGFLKFGKRHGKGEMTFKNGEIYKGEWFGGIKHGDGEYRWKNGDFYVGEFKLNMLWGSGKLSLSCGKCFEGEFWKNDIVEGKGQWF